MSFRTSNLGRTTWWVPASLLVLLGAVIWVFSTHTSTPELPPPSPQPQPSLPAPPPQAGELENQAQTQRSTVIQPPSHGSVRGRVVAEDWVIWPPGIELQLVPQAGGPPLQTLGVSSDHPRFAFEKVPLDHYRLILTAPDCLKQSLLLTVSADQPDQFFAVPLQPAASIVGQVVDADGRPVAHIPVAARFHSTALGASQVPITTSTGVDGRFKISGLRDGEFEVYVGTFRNPLSEVQIIGISRNAPEAWVSFTVGPMGSATIQINFLDGPEVAATDWRTLRVQAIRQSEGKGFSESLALKKDGSVHFPALPPGDYSFVAYGGPYRHVGRQATVHADMPLTLSIPMRRFP